MRRSSPCLIANIQVCAEQEDGSMRQMLGIVSMILLVTTWGSSAPAAEDDAESDVAYHQARKTCTDYPSLSRCVS